MSIAKSYPLVFTDYTFLARHQVRRNRPNGQMRFLMDGCLRLLPHPEQATILDLGGGTNSYLTFLNIGQRKIICDPEAEALAGMRGVETVEAALPRTGLPSGIADWVSAGELIEHLAPEVYEEGLREIARLSRRFVAITSPFYQHLASSLVRCSGCGSLYRCDGHFRRYTWADIQGLQAYFGRLVRLGFFTRPQAMFDKRIAYRLRHVRQILRGMRLWPYARPPFTKCPICMHEEFFAYEEHQRESGHAEDTYWLTPLPWCGEGIVGDFFLAVFDRDSSP